MTLGLLANRFGLLGAFVGKYAAFSVLLTSALLVPLLIAALLKTKFELGMDEGFVPENAPSRREISAQKEFFGETNRSKEWYMALFGVANSPEGNMLQPDHFGEMNAFYERVTQKTEIDGPRGNFTYAQICQPLCEINDQLQKLMENDWLKVFGQVQMRYPISKVFSYDVNIGKHVFNRSVDEKGELIGAKFVAFYFASFSREAQREKELELFEQAVEREAQKHNAQKGKRVELIAHGANAVSREMARGMSDAARNKLIGLALSMLLYLALHTFAGWLCGQSPGHRLVLALLSLCLPALSLLASVGFISIFGFAVSFVFFSPPLLLFSLLLNANVSFQFSSAWCRLLGESRRKHFTASERLASTFDQVGPSFLSVHLPPICAFLLLFCILPALNYRALAAFLAFLHLNSALLQVFLFAPFLALFGHCNSAHFRFENGNSNAQILDLIPSDETIKKTTTGEKAANDNSQTKKSDADNSAKNGIGRDKKVQKAERRNAKRAIRQCFARKAIHPLGVFLSSLPGKCAVLSVSALLLGLSLARGLPLLSNGMDYRRLLPDDSSALRGFDLMDTIWMDFLQILYVIRRPPNFEDAAQYSRFKEFLGAVTSMPQALAPRAHQSWLFDYHRDQLGSDLFEQLSSANYPSKKPGAVASILRSKKAISRLQSSK